MRLNLLQSEKKQFLGVLSGIAEELRGIRVALELLALKERATPIPDAPDASEFVAQTDKDFAEFEAMSHGRSLPDDEVFEGEDEGDEAPQAKKKEAPTRERGPTGSFLPRFG